MKRIALIVLALAALAALSFAPNDGYARGHYYGVGHGPAAGCAKTTGHADPQSERDVGSTVFVARQAD